ncbi:hypothetical protein [Mesorhizobium retamae]|uniref:DUF4926 domain-containing protein n=1 Tax=Mesorhizobium retamae TaxID=2912854 RepID=A0ABS9QI27_9HYPH|nr:hypothetical protein [Mesorhizobium sp. IRAMC:0171]MCG7507097.1 hypothetical protein [Mesorhizobium sp. IRAMC:0171]
MSGNNGGDDTATEDIYAGDLVELVVQPAIYGMAIGFEGSLVHVRLVDGTRAAFHEYELRKMAGVTPPADEDSNVIPVDFTRGVRMDRNTKTKGAA